MLASVRSPWQVVLQENQAAKRVEAKPKHPPKVHIWAAISKRGATPIVIFKGVLTSTWNRTILETALLPFVARNFPGGHCFQQDNDPKHTSNYTKTFLLEKVY